ncbi:MAG: SCO family protein [Pseudomonadota bacterium]
MSIRIVAIILSAFVVGAGGALLLNSTSTGSAITSSGATKTTGKALIGGPFRMVSHKGEAVTHKTLEGRHTLMFFGFTHCPDICPASLQVTSEALELLGDTAKDVQPVFVTVDPGRDTPEVLKSYLEDFDDRIIGLTGTEAQTNTIAKAYRIYHAKVADPNSEGGYTVDHSAYLYLMSPQGAYIKHFPPAVQAEELAAGLKAALRTS